MFPPGIEPGTFRVLGGCDNHYTTETCRKLSWNSINYKLGNKNNVFKEFCNRTDHNKVICYFCRQTQDPVYEILCCVFCKVSVVTVDILAFSPCFFKLFANLKPANNNATKAPEVTGPANFSYLAENMVRRRLRDVTTHMLPNSWVAHKECSELTLV